MMQSTSSSKEKSLIWIYRPGHEGSILNGALDPLGEYVATTGCDGHLHIYKIMRDEYESMTFELVKKHKIFKKHT